MADQPSPRRRFRFDRLFFSTGLILYGFLFFCVAVQSVVVFAVFGMEMPHHSLPVFVALGFVSSFVFAGGLWLRRDRGQP